MALPGCTGWGVAVIERLLQFSWWAVFPGFLLVVLGFIRDRACFNRYHLLPGIDTQPTLAWALAAAYVLGHCWMVAAYLHLAVQTGELIPGPRSLRPPVWPVWPQAASMMMVLALEYAPARIWTALAGVTGACAW